MKKRKNNVQEPVKYVYPSTFAKPYDFIPIHLYDIDFTNQYKKPFKIRNERTDALITTNFVGRDNFLDLLTFFSTQLKNMDDEDLVGKKLSKEEHENAKTQAGWNNLHNLYCRRR